MSQPTDDRAGVAGVREAAGPAAPEGPGYLSARAAKRDLLEELKAGWEEGRPVPAEDLLRRWPGDPEADPDVASLLFEDYCQRRRHGRAGEEEPSRAEYDRRFPSQQDSLASLVRQHEVLRSLGAASGGSAFGLALPTVGDEVFGFHLRRELGRGAFARVFLAEQAELAGRPVVVKVSAREGDEPQTLAQLQHTHIVPIYSVHEDERAGVRAVCMPYFGGASLSRVLETAWADAEPPAHGRQLVEALARVAGPSPEGDAASRRADSLAHLAGLGYVRAVAWIGARLAEGLQHAHDRGVLHCDIKPSNILLSADGQPMLLDFNLARKVAGDRSQAQATLGGTVAYMAPEHLRALATRDPAHVRQVDPRSDVYALGMVLFEMLTGQRPFDQSASYSPVPALMEAMAVERARSVPSPRARRPDLPWGVESIVRKCLAPDPEDRYQRAEFLAEDLHRFLVDRPLRHAPELSWRERLGKWVRRHPRLATGLAVSAAAAALLLAGAGILTGVRAQLRASQAARDRQEKELQTARQAEARQRRRQFEEGVLRSLCLVNTTLEGEDHVRQGLEACQKALAVYGVLERDDWQAHPDWRRLSPAEQHRLSEDVRELLLLLARARVQSAAANTRNKGISKGAAGGPRAEIPPPCLKEALALLDRAEAIPGLAPSPALWQERAFYREQLGDRDGARAAREKAQSIPPATARDHYLLATNYAAHARPAEAVAELNRALEQNPRHYWSVLQRGICYQDLGEQALALADFSTCTALWPEFAWGYFNRGRALHQLGKAAEALADYSAALARDPGLASARLNRGLVLLDLQRHREALADFDAAAAAGLDGAVLHGGRGIALEYLGRHAEADAAFARSHARDPDNPAMLLGYGFAVARRLPARARAAFEKVLLKEPRNPRALYGLGMLWTDRSPRAGQALFFFNQALEAEPTFVPARRGRALVLAHRGEGRWARQDIDWCVAADPAGVTLYAAACVYALSSAKAHEPGEAAWTADRAVALLKEAFARGYGRDKAAADADLKAVWNHPGFRNLVEPPAKQKEKGTDPSPKGPG